MAAAVTVDAVSRRARRRVALAAEAAREVVPHVFIFFGGLGVVRGPVAVLAGRRGMGSRWYTGEAFLALPSACFECFELILAAVLLRVCESNGRLLFLINHRPQEPTFQDRLFEK